MGPERLASIEYRPDDLFAHVNRGVAYHRKGLFDLAIRDYTTAIGLQPGNALADFNRGLAYDKKGLGDLAAKDYAKAGRRPKDQEQVVALRPSRSTSAAEGSGDLQDETRTVRGRHTTGEVLRLTITQALTKIEEGPEGRD